MSRGLNYGMIGGGQGAFIGDTHRKSINIDGKAKLVAGCFSRSYENTLKTGKQLGLDESRLYKDYYEMAIAESGREGGIDFVVIVTPNNSHYDICKAFLNAGIHVSCDKPVTVNLEQALDLKKTAEEKGLQFLVTYTYAGYVTVKSIREMIDAGEIGEIRAVMGEYPQGWLADGSAKLSKQGAWRCDPKQTGNTNCLGDIGVHIENTVARMTGLKIKRLLAKMDIMVEGRLLDDNSSVMVEYENGACGNYWCSQIAIGHDNGLRVKIYGTKGSIFWFQEESEKLFLNKPDGSMLEIHRGHDAIMPNASSYERLPSGHSEGLLEAMGNLYFNFIDCVSAVKNGSFNKDMIDYPTIDDGLQGIRFVESCLRSSNNGNVWVEIL